MALAREVKVPHVVAFNRRYFPIVERFADLVRRTDGLSFVDAAFTRHHRLDSAPDGQGHGDVPFVVGTAIHTINLLEHLFGEISDCRATVFQSGGSPAWLADLQFRSGVAGRMRILPCAGSMTEWLEAHSPERSLYMRYSMYGADYPGRIEVHEAGAPATTVEGDATLPRPANEGFVGEYRELLGLVLGQGRSRSTLAGSVNSMRVAEMIEPLTALGDDGRKQ